MQHSIGFFFRESLRAMRRNAAPSFAALATITVTLIVVGVFIPIVQATTGAANTAADKVMVAVYMKSNASAADDARTLKELRAVPHVQRIVFVSKAQAFAQQKKANPLAYQVLGGVNPLPDTFHVFPRSPHYVLGIRSEILHSSGTGQMLDPSISRVSNRTQDTSKLLIVTHFVTITAAVLAALLVAASILLIANTIRLSLYARRREVEVMKLVGATDWFIRWPFVIEGIIVGAFGAVLAITVLGITKLAVLDPLAKNWNLIEAPRTIPFLPLLFVLVGAGVAVSAIGSGLSLRRFLRV